MMTWTRKITGLAALAALTAMPALAATRVGIRDTYLNGLEADSVWAAAKLVGVPLLEVAVHEDMTCPALFEGQEKPYRIDTAENCAKLLEAVRKNGCEIISFCAVVGFAEDKDDAASTAWIGKVTEAAAQMKVPVVMMPLGAGKLDQDAFLKRAVAFVKSVAPVAARTKVQLTVENLGPYLNKQEVLEPIMKAVPSDQVGLALDITNMYWFGYPPTKIYELAKTFAPYMRYCHAKNIKYPPEERDKQRTPGWEYGKYAESVRDGDLDWSKLLALYFQAGFKGNVTIEDDSLGRLDAAGKKRVIMDDAAYLREQIDKQGGASEPAGNPKVKFETSLGDFVIELYPDKAPATVQNFLRYVDEHYYDGTIFHRIISDFMIQGGGFTAIGEQKNKGLHDQIQNEARQSIKNDRGTIAMARTNAPHSATSQFFINVKPNAMLDPNAQGWGYCAFGRVVEGMDVVDKLKEVRVQPSRMMGGENSEPVDPPVLIRASRAK